MNNNRNNNRRRGRGNNRPQGSGQQLNRIDSRARGNAPQMLDKYKKLAHDAHLNGDRVQAEYYLQFADHYFRVIADTRTRQDDQRGRQERSPDGSEDGDEGDFGNENDNSFDQPYPREARRDEPRDFGREGQRDGAREGQREGNREGQRDGNRDSGREQGRDGPREPNRPRDNRNDRAPRREQADEPRFGDDSDNDREPVAVAEAQTPAENPFTRDNRSTRGLRPRRDTAARAPAPAEDDGDTGGGLDPALLPPAISEGRDAAAQAEAAPAPRKRGRPRKVVPVDDGNGSLETVNG